jgi:glutathione S-transferase
MRAKIHADPRSTPGGNNGIVGGVRAIHVARHSPPHIITAMGIWFAVAKLTAQTAGVLVAETLARSHLAAANPATHDAVWGPAEAFPIVPRAFGAVVLVNLIAASFAVIMLSFRVSKARTDYNVPLPTMYAAGKDAKSVKFNCVQRGHHQAKETSDFFLAASLVGGLRYPCSVALFGLVYAKARFAWADGYATGDPAKRYSSAWGKLIWTTLVGAFVAAGAVALELLGVL